MDLPSHANRGDMREPDYDDYYDHYSDIPVGQTGTFYPQQNLDNVRYFILSFILKLKRLCM